MAETPSKGTLFLIIAFSLLALFAIAWIVVKAPADDKTKVVEPKVHVDDKLDRKYSPPSFLEFIPPLNEHGDHSTLGHGHDSDVAYSNVVHPDWLNGEGCNLFDLDIYDADCDGIPNWLEDFHETGPQDPEDPYHQGAWNYDEDEIIHGMDGHYACDMYPGLLNCDARTLSNDETLTFEQNTDGGCVPDIVEIVRGTNPLDGADDHNADVHGQEISDIRCEFDETTLGGSPLSSLPDPDTVDPVDRTAPDLASIDPYLGDLSDDFDALRDEILGSLDLLDDYNQVDLDDSFLNVSGIGDALDDIIDLNGVVDAYGDFIDTFEGYADQGLDRYGITDETYTINGPQGDVSFTCEEPGTLYIPYFWDPVPTTPQSIEVTMSDEAGNESAPTVIDNVSIDPERWVVAIDRSEPTDRMTDASLVTFRVFFNYEVVNFDAGDLTLRTTGTLEATLLGITPDPASQGFAYLVDVGNMSGEGILQLDFALVNDIEGPDGQILINPGEYLVSRQTYIVDTVDPEAPDIVTPSDGGVVGNPGRIIANCPGAGHTLAVVGMSGPTISGSISSQVECVARGPVFLPIPEVAGVGPYDITVGVVDPLGRTATTVLDNISFNPDEVTTSITRLDPVQATTNSETLVFRVVFSEPVDPVGVDDFIVQRTGNIQAEIQSVDRVTVPGQGGGPGFASLADYDVTVSTGAGSGLVSIFLAQDHDLIEFATNDPVLRDFVYEREIYRVDKEIPESPSVIRPVTGGVSGSPTGIVVQCMSGLGSFDYDPFTLALDEYVSFAQNTYAWIQSYLANQFFVPINEWRTRHDVRFEFDLETSRWDGGWAVIRGWVDTQGLTIRPELRYTRVQGVPYVDEFRRYCVEDGRLGFEQANFEDGGWLWDLLTVMFNSQSYESVPVFAYTIDPATGELHLDDEISTLPGQKTPFVVSVPRVMPGGSGVPASDEFLQPDGLYAFAIVDPEFVVPLNVSVFGLNFNFGLPVPVQNDAAASFVFTGPGCFDIFNKQMPILTLDLETSRIEGGHLRPELP